MTATSPYDELTPESIKASMLSDLTAKGVDVSIREGSYANTLVSVAAYQLFKMYQQFPSLLHMAFPDETSGEYIDKNAAQIGMVRAAGKKATVEIAFTGTEGTYIAAGTALYAPESGLQFPQRPLRWVRIITSHPTASRPCMSTLPAFSA